MIRPRAIFSVRPWDSDDGDPAHPEHILGSAVTDQLCQRSDGAGALVALDDRRYALTGTTLAVGAPRDLRRYARRRSQRAPSSTERNWLTRVAETLAPSDPAMPTRRGH